MENTEKSSLKTVNQIRTFVHSHLGKTITETNPIVFGQFKQLLSNHPTWKDKLDSIEKIHVMVSRMNKNSTIVRLKTKQSKRFITISWRKCHVPRKSKKQKLDSDDSTHHQIKQKPGTVIFPCPTDMISPQDVNLFSVTKTPPNTPSNTPSNSLQDLDPETIDRDLTKKLTAAMRYAVRRQISNWRYENRVFRRCRQCQSLLNLHVDHVFPFVNIKNEFLEKCKLEVPTDFDYTRKCQTKFKKINSTFSEQWQRYHRSNAKLQWLCSTCNLKKGKRNV